MSMKNKLSGTIENFEANRLVYARLLKKKMPSNEYTILQKNKLVFLFIRRCIIDNPENFLKFLISQSCVPIRIQNVFIWKHTPQGNSFWSNLSKEAHKLDKNGRM